MYYNAVLANAFVRWALPVHGCFILCALADNVKQEGGLPLANRSRQTFIKRQKERARQEKQRIKAERRLQRSSERVKTENAGGDDPDIAGVVPGPQPQAWELMDVLPEEERVALEEAEEQAKKKAEKVAGN